MESKRNTYSLLMIGLQLVAIAIVALSWYKLQALTKPHTASVKPPTYLNHPCPTCDSQFINYSSSSLMISIYESYPGKVISIAFDPVKVNPGSKFIQMFFDPYTGVNDPVTGKLYDLVYAHIKVYFSAKAGDKPSPSTKTFDLFDYQDSYLNKDLSSLGFSAATPVLCMYNAQTAGSRAVIWAQY